MTEYDPARPSGSGVEPVDPGPYAPDHPPYPRYQYPQEHYPQEHYPQNQYPQNQYPHGQYPQNQYPQNQYQPSPYPPPGPPGPVYPSDPAQPWAAGPSGAPTTYRGPSPYSGVSPHSGAGPYGGPAPYPVAGYAPYPNPGGWGGPLRPGQVMAIAVLGYIEAGLLLVAGLFLLAGASAVSGVAEATNPGYQGVTAQFVLCGLADFVAAGLLIAGAVTFSSGRRAGRTMIAAATAIIVVESLYWILRFQDAGLVTWAVFFVVMPVVAFGLSFMSEVNAWLTARSPATR